MDSTTLYYGVDVSKDTLHISYQTGVDNKGQPQWQYQTLSNQLAELERWVDQLPPEAHLIFEHTGTYSARLGWVLALGNRPFSILTPAQSKGFAATLKSISKTDRSDASLLARYGQVFQPPLSQLADESLHQLRQQHKHLNDLRISQQAVANQLHALSYDPRASQKVKASLLVLQQSYLAQIALFDRVAGARRSGSTEPAGVADHCPADAAGQGHRSGLGPGLVHGHQRTSGFRVG